MKKLSTQHLVISTLAIVLLTIGHLWRSASAMPTQRFAPAAVTVTAASTTVLEQDLGGEAVYLNLEVSNAAGGDALATFAVQFRDSAGGEWHTVLSGADYGVATQTMPYCSAVSPATLAAGSTAHVIVNLYAADGLRLLATSAGTSTVTVQGSVRTVSGRAWE